MPTILVVDDNDLVRRTLQRILSGPYDVECVGGGREALELFNREKFDLVVTDVIMTAGDGIELIKQIRAAGSDVPIIAISGGGKFGGTLENAQSGLMLAQQSGANQTLTKPIRPVDLLDMVKRLLENR